MGYYGNPVKEAGEFYCTVEMERERERKRGGRNKTENTAPQRASISQLGFQTAT